MRLKEIYREGHPWRPNGYGYIDSRTGMKFDAMSADLKLQAENVIRHRKANPHVYPASEPKYTDKDWVMLEIEDYLCREAPEHCGEDNPKPDPTYDIQLPEKDCPKCGARNWLPLWCQACGRPKIISFKCAKCATKL